MLGSVGPSALASAAAVALLGGLAGLLGRAGFPGARRTVPGTLAAAALGAGMQLAFSVLADSAGWAVSALPSGPAALPLWAPVVAGGLLFNLLPAGFQAALFVAALHPVLHALRAAGLVDARAPARRALREVLVEELPTPAPAASSPRRA
jgi:hypothetical protein